jgi:WD40 repeat protein
MQWSPDSRYIAVYGYNSGKTFLLDVGQKQIIDRNIYFKGGAPNIAWSTDGSLLALTHINIGLFRVADGKELGRRDRFRYRRCSSDPRQAGAFTADGRFLWVSCGADGGRGSYRAAEKLTVPELELADSVDAEGAGPDYTSFTHDGRVVVEDGRLLLTSILLSCEKQPNINEAEPNCRHYVACLDLQTKKPCFPSFAIHSVLSAHYPYDLKLVPGSPQVITFWAWTEGRPPGPDPAFKIYDFAGNQVRQFGMRDEFKDISPREFAVTGSGLVIGTAGKRGGSNRGRLMVWNGRTGELLQNTSTGYASLLEGSPDGRFVAVLMGHEIKVYSTI